MEKDSKHYLFEAKVLDVSKMYYSRCDEVETEKEFFQLYDEVGKRLSELSAQASSFQEKYLIGAVCDFIYAFDNVVA